MNRDNQKRGLIEQLSTEGVLEEIIFAITIIILFTVCTTATVLDSYWDNKYQAEILKAQTELVKIETEQKAKIEEIKKEIIKNLEK